MARLMEQGSTSLYRTIVKTKILEDIKNAKYGYIDLYEGQEIEEIFGPYVRPWDSRNYSIIPRWRREPNGNKDWRGNDDYDLVAMTAVDVKRQVLTPVFKKTSDDTFVLAHEWIDIA